MSPDRTQASGSRATRRAYNAYIDEAGDEGFTRLGWRMQGVEDASSEWLVLGAAVVREELDREATQVVDRLRVAVNRTKSQKPLHWRDLRNDHAKKRRAMDMLAEERFLFTAVAMHKPSLVGGADALQHKKGYLYAYAARFLIERLSWRAKHHGRVVNLLFENRATTRYGDLTSYVRGIAERSSSSIEPGTIGDVRPVPPSQKGAQVADFFVSAAAESLEPDLDGNLEEDYLWRVRSRLYRPPDSEILKYGFKVFPPEAADLERYPWLSDL